MKFSDHRPHKDRTLSVRKVGVYAVSACRPWCWSPSDWQMQSIPNPISFATCSHRDTRATVYVQCDVTCHNVVAVGVRVAGVARLCILHSKCTTHAWWTQCGDDNEETVPDAVLFSTIKSVGDDTASGRQRRRREVCCATARSHHGCIECVVTTDNGASSLSSLSTQPRFWRSRMDEPRFANRPGI